MSVLTRYFAATFTFELTIENVEDRRVTLTLFKVPGPAHDTLGSMMISWGDGVEEALSAAADRSDVEAMMTDEALRPVKSRTHIYADVGLYHVTIRCASGFLPLAQLPWQTTALTSPLPTLTAGETDEGGRLVPADTLPPLVPARPIPTQAALEAVPPSEAAPAPEEAPVRRSLLADIVPDLFANNPHLSVFDDAFAATSIRTIPVELFTPVRRLASCRRLFAESLITEVPAGFLVKADEHTALERAFARCPDLVRVADPFAPNPLPYCIGDLLAGAPLALFSAFEPEVRSDLGAVRPAACADDSAFCFDWHARAEAPRAPIVLFYPMDFATAGDFLVDWGDGKTEPVDWNAVAELTHAYEKEGVYRVTLYSTENEPVRPFRLGRFVTAIYSAIPSFYERDAGHRGDFCGWAADARELTTLPADLFIHLGPCAANLEEAFAGCTSLTNVPEALFVPVAQHTKVDGAFAFCKRLPHLPASFASRTRCTMLDFYSAPSTSDLQKTS